MRTSTPRLFLECSNTDCFKYGWTFIPSPRRLCFSRCIFQCYWVRFFSPKIFPRLTTVSTVQTVRNKPEHFQNLSKHSSPHPTNKITREGSQNKKQWFSPRCGEMLSRSISSKNGFKVSWNRFVSWNLEGQASLCSKQRGQNQVNTR